MRILVVYCHPHADSFCHAMLERVLAGLARGRHEVEVIDLYAEGFNPVIDEAEWQVYMTTPSELDPPDTARHAERLRWAEGLVFVYPTWLFSVPALLKGWLERVFVPGVSFTLPGPGQHAPASMLRHIRLIAGVTSTGTPRWVMALSGSAGKRLLLRALRLGFAIRCTRIWLCLHAMETRTQAQRVRHLERIERRFARVR
ncbi:NAD(P)H oxidoreductase YRKL [Enhygromyxa salina]|uniref:NAD(P)H oxidoreductase YRKL n=1 Tax=Enhygromyxa salina TaxID=215803 RepID=A0A0C2D7Y3_9BACT|nr:NAD(P)H-dependent oxidoreductase [Enhygromyxa salina]KIG16112.1 NAD(P)H oxidoreductase YRKL [Enhygromyxa salina]